MSVPPGCRLAVAAGGLVLGTTLGLTGCAPDQHSPTPEQSAPQVSVGPSVPVPAPPADVATLRTRWARDFAPLQRRLSGPAGLSVVPVGTRADLTVGRWRSGVAWSTIKVPLAIAALDQSSTPRTRTLVRQAVTHSDNAAAAVLWNGLGPPKRASAATQRVIRTAGDDKTVVQGRRVRPGSSPFGQTIWALPDQARFAAGLGCRSDASAVLELMGQVVASQRFGLGELSGARAKPGWGPVGSGYLVRQVAVVTTGDGRAYGVAAAVQARDLAHGQADLDRMADWLRPRLRQLPPASCPG